MNVNDAYTTYCRPRLGAVLQAIRLDKSYHRAEGNHLYYYDATGAETEVTDFLGGYGASLFGHNHPELVEVAISSYRDRLPFNAQASCRTETARLGRKLNEMLQTSLGKDYVVHVVNTGSEATEAALKHAALYHHRRLETLEKQLRKKITDIREAIHDGTITVPPAFYAAARARLNVRAGDDIEHIFAVILQTIRSNLSRPAAYVAFRQAFHGLTTGAVQLTESLEYREPFARIAQRVIFVETENVEQLQRTLEEEALNYFWLEKDGDNNLVLVTKRYAGISAMFLEPVQGEGGIRVIPSSFLAHCRRLADEHQIPLVFDEIQCGMGRTGTFLCSEQSGVAADYYMIGKSLGGGLAKISALLIRRDCYDPDFSVIHASTFAEDDHSSRIAMAALELLESDGRLMANCRERGAQLLEGLERVREKYPTIIKEVRGLGLMIGIELAGQSDSGSAALNTFSAQQLLNYLAAGYLLHEHRIRVALCLSNPDVIRLEPSALIGADDCARLIASIERLCEVLYKQNVYELTRFVIGLEEPWSTKEIANFRKILPEYRKPKYAQNVAFLGHFVEARDMQLWDEGYSLFTDEQIAEYLTKLHRYIRPQVVDQITVMSKTGQCVSMSFIGLAIQSTEIEKYLINRDKTFLDESVEAAVRLAEENCAKVLGFGGYSSIITNNCCDVASDQMALTTGNALTVAMGLEALHRSCAEEGVALQKACFAAIGAGGNISSIYTRIVAEQAPRIILIGRSGRERALANVASEIYFDAFKELLACHSLLPPGWGPVTATMEAKELRGVAQEIADTRAVKNMLQEFRQHDRIGVRLLESLSAEMKDKAPIVMTSDYAMLRQANVIMGATNSAKPVIFPEHLGKGPIVICDIAIPHDVDDSVVRERPDVTVIQGGIVKLPLNPDFKVRGIPLPPGRSFACMAETIILGLSGIKKSPSRGHISKVQVKKLAKLAHIHGFELADAKVKRSY
ncbi:aminotransferase class III-fold pyridoxal phosphate-dependent enzyme [Sorangium sp. So ce281]|uniref:aminotransferase class III-fold pyridoxal phosphate-dependent enzyme n=1 Tax=unclassified Sorangium TaxID=2621164 RepID=UPI003F5EE03B